MKIDASFIYFHLSKMRKHSAEKLYVKKTDEIFIYIAPRDLRDFGCR